jgi:DNA-binding LacI/PurR family transcriptional regulator
MQRTDTIAFYTGYGVGDYRDRFLAEVLTGIQTACDEFKLNLLLFGKLTNRSPQQIHNELISGKFDGLLIHAAPDNIVARQLTEENLPAVAVADVLPSVPSVIADDAGGVEMLIEYLWNKGHRRICFAESGYRFESVMRRSAAFKQAVEARGGEPIFLQVPWVDTLEFVRSLVADPNHPTAICCWHDDLAYYLLQICLSVGIRVPEDIAITGFDGLLDSRARGRALVTVEAPWLKMAREATQILLKIRDGETVDNLLQFSTKLIEGDTA